MLNSFSKLCVCRGGGGGGVGESIIFYVLTLEYAFSCDVNSYLFSSFKGFFQVNCRLI